MGPVVPFLSDSPAHLEAAVRRIAESGAVHVTPIVLHLRPGTRDWYLRWLNETHPALLPRYRALYGRGSYAPKDYQAEIGGRVRELARRYGVGAATPAGARSVGGRRGMGPIRRPALREPSRPGRRRRARPRGRRPCSSASCDRRPDRRRGSCQCPAAGVRRDSPGWRRWAVPERYGGPGIAGAHHGLGIGDTHFERAASPPRRHPEMNWAFLASLADRIAGIVARRRVGRRHRLRA